MAGAGRVSALTASARVIGVSAAAGHEFTKRPADAIELIAGEGVRGDAHRGETVKHRSRVAQDPTQPNLRQVHLIASELIDELNGAGFDVFPGAMGENITTRDIDLQDLPAGTRLVIGAGGAVVELTGLRNPCAQLDKFRKGLMSAVLDRAENGDLIRKAGVMGIVIAGGEIRPDDSIRVELPPPPHAAMAPV